MSEGSPKNMKIDLWAHLCFKHFIIHLKPLSSVCWWHSKFNSNLLCSGGGGELEEPSQGTFPQIRDIYVLAFTANQWVVCSKEKERPVGVKTRSGRQKLLTVNKQMTSYTEKNRRKKNHKARNLSKTHWEINQSLIQIKSVKTVAKPWFHVLFCFSFNKKHVWGDQTNTILYRQNNSIRVQNMKSFSMMFTYVSVSPGIGGCRSYGGGIGKDRRSFN